LNDDEEISLVMTTVLAFLGLFAAGSASMFAEGPITELSAQRR